MIYYEPKNLIAIGANAVANSSLALGNTAQALGTNTAAVGDFSTAAGGYSAVFGTNSYADAAAAGGVAVGYNARVESTAPNSVALGQGSVADQPDTVSVGSAGNERRITNVANGIAPTDAVNKQQLDAAIGDVEDNAYAGIAAVAALTAIPDPMPGLNYSVGVGVGHYEGENAVAVGFKANVTEQIRFSAGVGLNDNKPVTNAGLGISW